MLVAVISTEYMPLYPYDRGLNEKQKNIPLLSSYINPLMPLTGNPEFPPGLRPKALYLSAISKIHFPITVVIDSTETFNTIE